MVAGERAELDPRPWMMAGRGPDGDLVGTDNVPERLTRLRWEIFNIFQFSSKEARPMVLLGTGLRGLVLSFAKNRVAKTCGLHSTWEGKTAMKASNSSTLQSSVCTRVLKLTTTGSNPWVVCTLDSVPVILARFECRQAAEAWQSRIASKSKAA